MEKAFLLGIPLAIGPFSFSFFGPKFESFDPNVCSGQLAGAGSDNKIRIISSYRGKTVFNYPTIQADGDNTSKLKPDITSIGWCVHFTETKSAEGYLEDGKGRLSVDDLLAPETHLAKASVLLKADLPRELALLDVESSLPKLSLLPSTGSE